MALALIIRLPAHRPREMLRIAPFGGAGRDEKLRHLLGVAVFVDRGVGRRAERVEQQQHAVAFDQLAHLLDGLRRAVAVVIGNEIDLAAVYPALLVDHVEKGGLRLADHAVGRGRAAIRVRVADLDLGVAGAGVVFLLRESRQPQPSAIALGTAARIVRRVRRVIGRSPFGFARSDAVRGSPRRARRAQTRPPRTASGK